MDKIKIKYLIDMDESDGAKIKEEAGKSKNINESILITQKNQNDKHEDNAILKVIKIQNHKKFE